MKRLLSAFFAFLGLLMLARDASSQIVINGHNPSRRSGMGPRQAVSISYGYILWKDSKNEPLLGYSASAGDFGFFSDPFSLEKYAVSYGLKVGYDVNVSDVFLVKAAFTTGKMYTGLDTRFDLVTEKNKSRFSQLAVYASYSLTKNLDHRLQFQLIGGPELQFAKRDVIIVDYVLDETDSPENYHQDVSVLEGSLVGGIGISLRVAGNFSLFTETLAGISLPGTGFKWTNTGMGLKFGF